MHTNRPLRTLFVDEDELFRIPCPERRAVGQAISLGLVREARIFGEPHWTTISMRWCPDALRQLRGRPRRRG